ncbi:TonB-dependent receptor [Cytophagaceae bacterium YF14B1]|uniref:TonB-dependent receptor n=1 Tax=Xanthocytophaga flava TaxID=3048013 RepID=A0AAE3QLM7_9BACT|nr:TonB-dependent receptor [Xanthocytophaga flavus]MDJ1479019.1 TonB-dependent receptor [Xanthocytophaga flavus]
MKKFTLLFIAMMLSSLSWAQYTISGRITSGGQPLSGATVSLQNTFKGSLSMADGRYYLRNLPSGKYVVIVSFIGYEKLSREIDLTSDLALDIDLKKMEYVADEIVVAATRASQKSGTTFTSVDKETLAKQNLGQDLPFLLNQTPSVVVSSDAGAGVGYTGIRIRGSDPTRINVTVNGIPMNDAESHGVYWVNMPDFASSVDNIQIQRGVGTSTNGAASFGATVNVQTNQLNQKPYAEINNAYGSFNTWKHTARVGTGLINGKWAFDGRLSKISSDGYVDRASSNLKSFFLSGGYYAGSTMIKFNVFSGKEVTYQAWNGVPEYLLNTDRTYNAYTYDNQTDNYQQDHYQLFLTHEFNRNWNANLALHYTHGEGYYEEYKPGESLSSYNLPSITIGDSVITATDLIRRRWLDNDFYGLVWSVSYNSLKRFSATLGGGANNYKGKHYGEVIWARFASTSEIRQRYYNDDASKGDINFYAKGNYDFSDKLNGFLDLQNRYITYSFLGLDQNLRNIEQFAFYSFFNPKIGITYHPSDENSAYASYSIGHREPTRDDFVQSTSKSRPKLERLRNLEVGFRKQNKRYLLSVNYYLMYYKNQLVLTGQINDVGAYTRTNIARSYRMGVEVEGNVKLSSKWTLGANATFSKNKIRKYQEYIDNYDTQIQEIKEYKETDISFSPNIIAAGTLSYKPLAGLEVSWLSKYVGKQYLDNTSNNNRKLNSFFVNDIRINYTVKPKFVKEIGFNVLVNNMFNHLYESNGYTFSYISEGKFTTENYYYPQAGTNFLLSVNLKF